MKIGPKKNKSNPSDDLTVVLIRGNGNPRTFRLSLPALHRSLTALGFVFVLAVLSSVVLAGYSVIRVTPPGATIGGGTTEEGGSPASSAEEDTELAKEVSGLREDISRLNAQIDNRTSLPNNSNSLLQLMSSRSTLVPESESIMRIRNPKAVTDETKNRLVLNFELHNVGQRQERGYITVLAKTADSILSYPAGLFAPNQNILLDFNKGETFAISRFRQAEAVFPLAPLKGKRVSYQILLFGTDGKVLANAHVEDTP